MFEFILIAAFVIFILPKLLRELFVWLLKRQARKMYTNAFGTPPPEQQPRRQKGGWSAPTARRKKIDPSVGEYVRFQEITDTTTTEDATDSHTTSYTVEQQVVDAVWEEIPPK